MTVPPERGAGAGAAAAEILALDAAVGLLRRSIELLLIVGFFEGVGIWGAAFRDRARDAAVGANKPVEGVFGRADVGVLAREAASERDGVLLTGVAGTLVAGLLVVALEATDWPVCCGFKGWAIDGVAGCLGAGDFRGVFAGVLDDTASAFAEDEGGVFVEVVFEAGILVVALETLEVRGVVGVLNFCVAEGIGVAASTWGSV